MISIHYQLKLPNVVWQSIQKAKVNASDVATPRDWWVEQDTGPNTTKGGKERRQEAKPMTGCRKLLSNAKLLNSPHD